MCPQPDWPCDALDLTDLVSCLDEMVPSKLVMVISLGTFGLTRGVSTINHGLMLGDRVGIGLLAVVGYEAVGGGAHVAVGGHFLHCPDPFPCGFLGVKHTRFP